MEQVKDIFSIVFKYFLEVFKYFKIFPDEFFDLIEKHIPSDGEAE